MVQNSNISISSGTARFINAPIGRKKRAVSSKKPMTDRLTYREENKAKKRPQTAPTVSFLGNGSLPVSRESTPNQCAGTALRGGLSGRPNKRKEHHKYEENHDRTTVRTDRRIAERKLPLQLYRPGVRTIPQYRKIHLPAQRVCGQWGAED